jgi:hypothetical protein
MRTEHQRTLGQCLDSLLIRANKLLCFLPVSSFNVTSASDQRAVRGISRAPIAAVRTAQHIPKMKIKGWIAVIRCTWRCAQEM